MNLNINTGKIRVTVNDDPDRVIAFNPTDVGFAERFYALVSDIETKQREFMGRAKVLDEAGDERTGEQLHLLRDICTYMRDQIDTVFGEGTSAVAFGDAMTLDMFTQFFDGILPIVRQARAEKLTPYMPKMQA